ncbi:MAG: serine/threonine-protein kinase [Myxococcota bacterium]
MEVKCGNCGRSFDVSDIVAERTPAAQCVCGARLNLAQRDGVQRLGKYLLQRRIAVGGMGEIFYGKIAGIEGFEREVAIKKMLPHLSEDRSFIDMMVKEAKLTVLLNHPNIVQVFDLAKEGDEYYIAMEYVPGTNVGQMLELCHKNRIFLPVEVATYITMQVLRGLAYAHELNGPDGEPMNILHRDITPQNILVTPNAWVKITDFGIAKARNEISTTRPGMIKGKLGYIAPEQLQGRDATQSVDIFCAGILLWESLATRRLFKGSDEIDTFRIISECKVPPLSGIRDDVNPELEKVILHALEPTPESRFATAEKFYDELNKAIFPRTVDDFASATKRYFQEHHEFFEKVVTGETVGLDGGQTVQIESPSVRTEDLPIISALLSPPPAPLHAARDPDVEVIASRSPPWGLIAAAVLAVLLGSAAWYFAQSDPIPTPVMNGLAGPTPLTQEELQLAVQAEEPKITACYREGTRKFRQLATLHASMTIASTGGVAAATLDVPEDGMGDARGCITRVLRAMRLREHSQPRFDATVTLPPPKDHTSAPPPPKANTRADTSNRGRGPLNGSEIQAGVQKRQGAIARCLRMYSNLPNDKVPKQIVTQMTIAQSGRVTNAAFQPQPPASIAKCLTKQMTAIRYRKQPTENLKAKIPLTIQTHDNGR